MWLLVFYGSYSVFVYTTPPAQVENGSAPIVNSVDGDISQGIVDVPTSDIDAMGG